MSGLARRVDDQRFLLHGCAEHLAFELSQGALLLVAQGFQACYDSAKNQPRLHQPVSSFHVPVDDIEALAKWLEQRATVIRAAFRKHIQT